MLSPHWASAGCWQSADDQKVDAPSSTLFVPTTYDSDVCNTFSKLSNMVNNYVNTCLNASTEMDNNFFSDACQSNAVSTDDTQMPETEKENKEDKEVSKASMLSRNDESIICVLNESNNIGSSFHTPLKDAFEDLEKETVNISECSHTKNSNVCDVNQTVTSNSTLKVTNNYEESKEQMRDHILSSELVNNLNHCKNTSIGETYLSDISMPKLERIDNNANFSKPVVYRKAKRPKKVAVNIKINSGMPILEKVSETRDLNIKTKCRKANLEKLVNSKTKLLPKKRIYSKYFTKRQKQRKGNKLKTLNTGVSKSSTGIDNKQMKGSKPHELHIPDFIKKDQKIGNELIVLERLKSDILDYYVNSANFFEENKLPEVSEKEQDSEINSSSLQAFEKKNYKSPGNMQKRNRSSKRKLSVDSANLISHSENKKRTKSDLVGTEAANHLSETAHFQAKDNGLKITYYPLSPQQILPDSTSQDKCQTKLHGLLKGNETTVHHMKLKLRCHSKFQQVKKNASIDNLLNIEKSKVESSKSVQKRKSNSVFEENQMDINNISPSKVSKNRMLKKTKFHKCNSESVDILDAVVQDTVLASTKTGKEIKQEFINYSVSHGNLQTTLKCKNKKHKRNVKRRSSAVNNKNLQVFSVVKQEIVVSDNTVSSTLVDFPAESTRIGKKKKSAITNAVKQLEKDLSSDLKKNGVIEICSNQPSLPNTTSEETESKNLLPLNDIPTVDIISKYFQSGAASEQIINHDNKVYETKCFKNTGSSRSKRYLFREQAKNAATTPLQLTSNFNNSVKCKTKKKSQHATRCRHKTRERRSIRRKSSRQKNRKANTHETVKSTSKSAALGCKSFGIKVPLKVKIRLPNRKASEAKIVSHSVKDTFHCETNESLSESVNDSDADKTDSLEMEKSNFYVDNLEERVKKRRRKIDTNSDTLKLMKTCKKLIVQIEKLECNVNSYSLRQNVKSEVNDNSLINSYSLMQNVESEVNDNSLINKQENINAKDDPVSNFTPNVNDAVIDITEPKLQSCQDSSENINSHINSVNELNNCIPTITESVERCENNSFVENKSDDVESSNFINDMIVKDCQVHLEDIGLILEKYTGKNVSTFATDNLTTEINSISNENIDKVSDDEKSDFQLNKNKIDNSFIEEVDSDCDIYQDGEDVMWKMSYLSPAPHSVHNSPPASSPDIHMTLSPDHRSASQCAFENLEFDMAAESAPQSVSSKDEKSDESSFSAGCSYIHPTLDDKLSDSCSEDKAFCGSIDFADEEFETILPDVMCAEKTKLASDISTDAWPFVSTNTVEDDSLDAADDDASFCVFANDSVQDNIFLPSCATVENEDSKLLPTVDLSLPPEGADPDQLFEALNCFKDQTTGVSEDSCYRIGSSQELPTCVEFKKNSDFGTIDFTEQCGVVSPNTDIFY